MTIMIKKLLLRVLRSDPDFAVEVWEAIGKPQLFQVDKKHMYILVVDVELSEKQVAAFKENVPANLNISLIHGASATLIDLIDLTNSE